MNVIYEVNLELAPHRAAAFAEWLPGHVAELLALPGFLDAEISTEQRAPGQPPAWSVRYRLRDPASLEAYFTEHAERMRAEGLRRFGADLKASRRILYPLAP